MRNTIAEKREKMKPKQAELAELSGVPRSTITEIEQGKRMPRLDTAIMIANALQVIDIR